MKNFKKWLAAWWITCASLLVLAACGGSFETEASRFSANLTGDQEVPPTGSTATGTGVVTVNPETLLLTATVNTSGITATEAHIHEGAPGQNGPVVIPLTQTAPGSGVWVAAQTITEEQLATLRAGNYYFNVHSAAFPNGEIRGQIRVDQFGGGTTTTSAGGTTTTSAGGTTTSTAAGGTTTSTAAGGTTTSTGATTTTSAAGTTTSTAAGGTTTSTAAGGTTTSSPATTSSTAATTTTVGGNGTTTTTVVGGGSETTTTSLGGTTSTTAIGGTTSTLAGTSSTAVSSTTTSTVFGVAGITR